jgi:hypothetical protein
VLEAKTRLPSTLSSSKICKPLPIKLNLMLNRSNNKTWVQVATLKLCINSSKRGNKQRVPVAKFLLKEVFMEQLIFTN